MLTQEQEDVLAKIANQAIADERAAAERQAAIDKQETQLGEATIDGA